MDQHETPVLDTAATLEARAASKKKWVIVGVIALVLIATSQLYSPERAAERMIENALNGQYDVDVDMGRDGSIEYSGEYDGTKVQAEYGEDVSLPADWPDSIPVAPGAKISQAAVSVDAESGKTIYMVVYETSESVSALSELYSPAFTNDGWVNVSRLEHGDGLIITATRGEDEVSAVYLTGSAHGTDVQVTVQVAK